MSYKITQRVVDLVTDLISDGYDGEVTITNSYPSGARSVLEEAFSVQITGFCKESLYITEDLNTEDIVFVGRYSLERCEREASVEDIVDTAWGMYKSYKDYSNYGLPSEFQSLFITYGYIIERTVTKTVYEEKSK